MKDLLRDIADASPDFVELRHHRRVQNGFTVQKGRVEEATSRTRSGIGVRALVDGVWGFASTSELERDSIRRAVDRALEAARDLAARATRKTDALPETELAQGDYVGEGYDELLEQPLCDKLGRVVELERETLAASSRVHTAASRYSEIFEEKTIVTSDGAAASYRLVRPELVVRAFAEKSGSQVVGHESVGVTGGWHCLFDHETARGIPQRAAQRAVDQLDAPHVAGGERTVILSPSIVGLLSHEAIGHTVEADLVLAGSVAAGKIGQTIASDLITLCDSGHSEHASGAGGTLPFDDEGVACQRTVIIEDGRLVSYLHNRETAAEFGVEPTGNARAWEYSDEPLIRMRNTYIEPGETTLEEMIASTEDGFLLDNPGSGQADATGEFMFGAGVAVEIKGGKLGRTFREVTLSGVAFDVLQTVDAVSREFRWDLGSGYCGKWQPAKVDAGGPYLRCRLSPEGASRELDLKSLAEQILGRALKAGADEVFVRAARSEDRRMGFERGELNLSAAGEETVLMLQVHCDHRLASAQTNSAAPADIERTVASAIEIAKLSTFDEHLNMPAPRTVLASSARYDAALAALGPKALGEMTQAFVDAMKVDRRVSIDSGAVEWEVGEEFLLSSHGVDVSDRWTHLDWTGSGQGLDGDEVTSLDYLSGMSWKLDGAVDTMRTDGARLGRDILSCFGAGRAESYKGRMLLTPRAVEDLVLEALDHHLSGLQVLYDKSSLGDDKIGTPITNPLFTLVDDPTDIALDGCTSYDSEGMPAVTTDFIRAGRLERHMENAYSAKRRGKPMTGHASLGLHAPVVFPKNTKLVDLLDTGSSTQLLVLHRFSGNVDGASGDFSGVAKGSYVMTEGGQRRPIKETMLAGNLFEMLNAIEAVENRAEVVDGKFKAPHILVDGISVTGED